MSGSAAVVVKPVEGWGFNETIDGKLAGSFQVEITEAGVPTEGGIIGWYGKATTGKYQGADLMMTPRHSHWSGVVVLRVRQENNEVFNGMADTEGLKCNWK